MAIFATLFDALNKSNIRYVVVGGLAAVLHGYVRLTVDMIDIEQLEKIQKRKKGANGG
jgi:hypothetical protein